MLKKAQGKDQNQNGNADLIFMMLGEMDSEKDCSILMKHSIGIIADFASLRNSIVLQQSYIFKKHSISLILYVTVHFPNIFGIRTKLTTIFCFSSLS